MDKTEPGVTQHRPKHVVAVMSGKGGVGKSTVTALLAISLTKRGRSVGILDADITGASIPKLFGLQPGAVANEEGMILPAKTRGGIAVMSANLLLSNADDPVIWRSSLIDQAVKQFWDEVAWGDLDDLIVDLPPGTGDVPLTVIQSLPLEGVIIVSSPQELAVMIVQKSIKMAAEMNIPVLGIVENMSYALCPHCGEKVELFGPSRAEETAAAFGVTVIGRLPLDPQLAALGGQGRIEEYDEPGPLTPITEAVMAL